MKIRNSLKAPIEEAYKEVKKKIISCNKVKDK